MVSCLHREQQAVKCPPFPPYNFEENRLRSIEQAECKEPVKIRRTKNKWRQVMMLQTWCLILPLQNWLFAGGQSIKDSHVITRNCYLVPPWITLKNQSVSDCGPTKLPHETARYKPDGDSERGWQKVEPKRHLAP